MGTPSPSPRFDPDATVPDRSLRILVADDQRDQAATLALLLLEQGHRVREVYRGGSVLRHVRDFRPDVVLLDIGMPGMSGYEVAREIRDVFKEDAPALVAVTGYDKGADKILAKIVGFDEYVTKPYDPKMLLAMLGALALRQPAHGGPAPETGSPLHFSSH